MVTICLLHIFFHTNDAPHHPCETWMQLWSHSMKTSLHHHICVYPCADAIAAVVLRLRWNFNSSNTYLLTYLHSRCLRGTLTVVRERGSRVLTWAPCNRKTFTIRGGMMNEICAQHSRWCWWWWWWWQLLAHLQKPNLSHPTPCSTSTNFNQLLEWVSEWVSDFNGSKVALPFPLTSWHLSEINHCTRLADWFLQALIIVRIKCFAF